jgi:hypothetical protein
MVERLGPATRQIESLVLGSSVGLPHPDHMAKPAPGSSLALPTDQAEPIAAIQDMIATLKDLRLQTNDRALLGAYQAARGLDARVYRLGEVGAKLAPVPTPISVPSSPQRNLPLGPVVVARRSKHR